MPIAITHKGDNLRHYRITAPEIPEEAVALRMLTVYHITDIDPNPVNTIFSVFLISSSI